MIVSVEGEEANGKTTFLYTGPLPCVGFAFDMGVQRALQGSMASRFGQLKIETVPYKKGAPAVPVWQQNGADITIFELPPPIQIDNLRVKGMRELWDTFIVLLTAAYEDVNVECVVIDTMTIARRIKADAYLQQLQEKWTAEHPGLAAGATSVPNRPDDQMRVRLQQIEYGPVNDAIRDIYTMAQGLHKNLAVSHHLTDERMMQEVRQQNGDVRKESVVTGNRILEGLAQTHRYVDIALLMEKVRDVSGKTTIRGTFRKCGYNLDEEGKSVNNPTWNSIAGLIELGVGGSVSLPKRL